jgi:TonB-linked SusC/RagA family outer membrane protein
MNNFSLSMGGRAFCFLFLLGAMLSFSPVQANNLLRHPFVTNQQIQIQGTVTDGEHPLAGVAISIQGKSNVVIATDFSGHYTLSAPADAVLVFTYVGYRTQTVSVQGRTAITIILQDNTTQLQEVKINAGYYSVKNSERTGSIARITAKDIQTQPVSNVLAAMQGRMAGVDIIQDGGTAGGGFSIKIRGLNSLRANGNEPLYIIDGVPYSSETIGYSNTTTGMVSPTSPLNSINPADVESIEVLKDADATAIYGSRGANGVVLVTTKKGRAGRTKVNVAASTGVGKITKMLDMMHTEDYLSMRKQGFANDGITSYPATAYDVNGTWDQKRYTDWQKELMGGTAAILSMQASVSGGSDLTQFLLSGTYRSESTVIPGDFGYDRTAVHFNMNHASDDKKFKLVFSGGYTFQNNLQSTADVTRTARNLPPNAPALYDKNGNLNFENGTFQNPVAPMGSYSTAKTNDLVTNAVLSYELLPSLEIKANLGFTDLKNDEQRVIPSTIYDPIYKIDSSSSILYCNLTQRQSWIVEPQLHWSHSFAHSKIDVLAGATAQQQSNARLYEYGVGFSSNSLITDIASAAKKFIVNSDETMYRYQAFFGRINYNYQEKYILNLTGRRDGSSRFGPGKQFAVFGAAGAAWLFSNENFLKDNTVISFGKLRASYGTSGSDQIGDYQFLDTYASSGGNYQGVVGMDPARLYNPDFGWESSQKLEIALETGFFSDKLFLTLAHYNNKSSNQLVGVPLPGTTGFSSINANLDAAVQNSGFELTLRTVNFSGKDFKWMTNFNISAAKNKLLSFPGLDGSTYSNRYVIGKSTSIVKVYEYKGVNPQTGWYQVTDVDGDGKITALQDKKTVEDLTPKYFGGLQNQLHYKNLQLDFLFQFVKQKNYDWNPYVPGGSPINQYAALAEAWEHPGDIKPYQINTSGQNGNAVNAFYNYYDSSAMIVDGSYIRLKNIELSYILPLPAKGINCRLSLQGQNVLTFTPYKGGDPEFKYTGFLSPLQVYTAGIQLTF